jgi:hypothetical protein
MKGSRMQPVIKQRRDPKAFTPVAKRECVLGTLNIPEDCSIPFSYTIKAVDLYRVLNKKAKDVWKIKSRMLKKQWLHM